MKQTICITRMLGLLYLAVGLATGACTNEVVDEGGTPPAEPDTGRREVLLTLKNKLAFSDGSTRGLATAAENELSSLDVYVFGSETETGTYTFQECFSYRGEGAGKLPAKATLLPLAADPGDETKTTGLMGLKKGLFVKLYCVANAPRLTDPATGRLLTADDFTKLKLNTATAGAIASLQTPGIPTEADFLTYHTPVLTEGVATDVLVTPLSMSGAYTTPIDLTDPAAASRLNIGFKLTRLVTRFDVVNNAATSRFTLQSISMGNGRRGATFFPIAVCDAQASVASGKLITYPVRPFDGAQANQGFQPGAFYTYASPQADGGYLILKGLYQVNATEQKEVSYQVPFRQVGPDGKEVYLDIEHNHRYTLGITKAADYHLDFNLKVEDWADDGSVDGYKPDNKPGEIVLGDKDTETEYEEDPDGGKHTVKMSLVAGSHFEVKITATAMLQVTKSYAGGQAGQQYDWITITEPVTSFADGPNAQMEYTYGFTLTPDYKKGRFPRTTVRFFDPISGNESILYIEAISAPTPIESPQPGKAPNGSSENPNSVDMDKLEVSLYRISNSQANVSVTCADAVELESSPAWLTVTKIGTQLLTTSYSIVLNDRDVADTEGKVVFHNVNKPALKTEYSVKLLAAPIQTNFQSLGGSGNTFAADESGATLGNLTMNVVSGNTAAVITTPMDGVTTRIDFDGGPEWLKSSAPATTRAVVPEQQVVTFSLQESKLVGAKTATVTLINKIGGKDEVFTISPQLNVGTIEKISSVPSDDVLNGTTKTMTLYKLPVGSSEMKLKVTSYGGSVLSSDNACVKVTKTATTRSSSVTQEENVAYYTLTATAPGTATLTHTNLTDSKKTESFAVTVLASDITGNAALSLSAVPGKTVSISISSPKGFTAQITDYGVSQGGKSWLKLNATNLSAGSQSLSLTVQNDVSNVRPVTIKLTNKIINGGDHILTVTPAYLTPALTKIGNATPVQNTLTGSTTTATMKLYQVTNSQMVIKASGAGGSRVTATSGVTVTGGDTYATDNTYTVKLSGSANGSFQIVNKSDPGKVTRVTVTAASATISANNISVAAANSGTTNIPVNSPEGVTVAIVNGWNGGGDWCYLSASNLNGGSQNIQLIQRNNTATIMKPITLRLTNKIAGGSYRDITVTPTFVAPTLSESSHSLGNIIGESTSCTFTVTAAGGYEVATPFDSNIATLAQSGNTCTVNALQKGVTTVRFRNKSDNSKTVTYTLTVERSYGSAGVHRALKGYYIAPVDAGEDRWTSNINSKYCADKFGARWFVPSMTDIQAFLGGDRASDEIYNDYKTRGVFTPGRKYWLTDGSGSYGSVLDFSTSGAGKYVDMITKINPVRCVTRE